MLVEPVRENFRLWANGVRGKPLFESCTGAKRRMFKLIKTDSLKRFSRSSRPATPRYQFLPRNQPLVWSKSELERALPSVRARPRILERMVGLEQRFPINHAASCSNATIQAKDRLTSICSPVFERLQMRFAVSSVLPANIAYTNRVDTAIWPVAKEPECVK